MSQILDRIREGGKDLSNNVRKSDLVRHNQGFFNDMGSTFKQIMLPALAAGVGTGAVTAHLSSKTKDPNETGRARRRRILRNALLGFAGGAGAATAIPMGLKMLNAPLSSSGSRASMTERAADGLVNFGGRNLLPLGIAGTGGLAIHRSELANKREALTDLYETVRKTPGDTIASERHLANIIKDPKNMGNVLGRYVQGIKGKGADAIPGVFAGNELLAEAGGRWTGLKDISKAIPSLDDQSARNLFREYLAEQGLVGRGMSKLVGKTKPVLGVAPEQIAEGYSRFARPSLRGLGRFSLPAKLGLLGAGVVAGKQVQNRLTGD